MFSVILGLAANARAATGSWSSRKYNFPGDEIQLVSREVTDTGNVELHSMTTLAYDGGWRAEGGTCSGVSSSFSLLSGRSWNG